MNKDQDPSALSLSVPSPPSFLLGPPGSELMATGGCEAGGGQGDQWSSPEPHPVLLLPEAHRFWGKT